MSESSGWQLASASVAEASERYLMSTFGYAWTQALVQLVAPQEGDRVLDVACGTGPVTRYIAPFVGSTGRVVGLDLNSGMLDTARAMPIPEGIQIEWREATRRRGHFRMPVLMLSAVSWDSSSSRIVRRLYERCTAPGTSWPAGFGCVARSRASTFLCRIDGSPGKVCKRGSCCEPASGLYSQGSKRYSRTGRRSGISRYSDQDQKSAYPVSVPGRVCAGLFVRDAYGWSNSRVGRSDP